MAFTRLSTAAQVKAYLENIETTELTDAQIEGFIDQEDIKIRDGFGFPYLQIFTDTSPNEFIYFMGEINLFAVERAFHDLTEVFVTTDFTVDLEKGLFTFVPSFTVESKELLIWVIPRRFSELSAVRTALYIMTLSEGFQRGEPSKNLMEIEKKHKMLMNRMVDFDGFEVDSMGTSFFAYSTYSYSRARTRGLIIPYHPVLNPYGINQVRIIQDHDRNAYL